MIHNHHFTTLLLALVASGQVFAEAPASAPGAQMESLLEHQSVAAVERGLGFLASVQRADGSYVGKYPNVCAALASMAFMASGHFPGRGKYGRNMERAVLWLAKQADDRGYFGNDGGRMYGHGICTLALTEAYGMLRGRSDNLRVRDAIRKSINLIVGCQAQRGHYRGGWRYEPHPDDADLSITAWQVQALRGAQNCQIPIPQETISQAIDYVKRCYNGRYRGFAYQPGQSPSLPMRSAGLVVMRTLKEIEHDSTKQAGRELIEQRFGTWGGHYFYYQTYYAATAGLMLGKDGQQAINVPLEKLLISKQTPNGSWPPAPSMGEGERAGPVYFTAFACLALAARYQYLPIYQE